MLLIYPTTAETPSVLLDGNLGPQHITDMHADIKLATTPLGKRDGDIEDIASIEVIKHHSQDNRNGDSVAPLDTVSAATTVTTTTTTPTTGNPVFPPKSVSCQQCRVHYPKLVECNQVANRTLATLSRLPPPTRADDKAFVQRLDQPRPDDDSSATITVIMPFLQCICPDQGVLGLKSCLTCFKLSSQASNFLQELVLQNVTTSLKAYTNLCLETGNGTFVPPPGHKGASASQNSFSCSSTPSWTTIFTVVLWCLVGLGLGS
ncbi:hypothetical protein BGZ82_007230 [Podila clonocystis]|nr:hypothetical protein BGZ82_007230 [Podila clonocystis]